jgi:hypothetical protein
VCTDEVAQLALEGLSFTGQRADALDLLSGDTNPSSLRQRSEAAGDALELARVVELARGALEALRDVSAILDRPRDLMAELTRPAQSVELALLVGRDLSLTEHLPRSGVDCREGVGALVGVHSITIIQHVFSIEVSFEWTSGGQL